MSDAQEMERFFRERGFGQLIGWGDIPALLVIDLTRAFTDPALPDGAALKAAVRLYQPRRSRCETGLGWAAREETGFASRTDREKGLSTTALSRYHERTQDRVIGMQRPTRIEGRLRQRRLTHLVIIGQEERTMKQKLIF